MNLDKLKGHIPDVVITQIPGVMEKFQINTPLRLAHFLAQCGNESGGFRLTKENLNLIHLLQCPISNEDLKLSEDKSYLMSIKSNIKYPIIDGIPILIETESF